MEKKFIAIISHHVSKSVKYEMDNDGQRSRAGSSNGYTGEWQLGEARNSLRPRLTSKVGISVGFAIG